MQIISIPELIKETTSLIKTEEYIKAYEITKDNIKLNKKYNDGEYVFKNLLEEILFTQHFNKNNEHPIKKKYPLMMDYSTLYSNYGKILFKLEKYDDAEKSFNLARKYNPTNVESLFGLANIYKEKREWEKYYKIVQDSFKFSYTKEAVAKSFKNLATYYFHKEEKDNENKENKKIGAYLNQLSEEFDKKNNDDKNEDLNKIKEFLESKEIATEPSKEILIIAKNLGFQLYESKKVVPALYYFNIVYDLSKDPDIKEIIEDLEKKIDNT